MSRKYNFIYKKLVKDRGDIIGHIAYALYKDEKIEYITKFKEDHNGEEPTEDDLRPFNDISCTEKSIEKYRFVATSILQDFLDNTLNETSKDIENNIVNNYIELIRKAIEPLKPSSKPWAYFHGIMQSVIGAFVFMVIMCALVFLLSLSKNKFVFTIGGEGNAKMERVDSLSESKVCPSLVPKK